MLRLYNNDKRQMIYLFQYKEEQAKRKVTSLEEAANSYRGLKYDTERALRTELSALKDQVAKVSKRLLQEENENQSIKNEVLIRIFLHYLYKSRTVTFLN